MQTRGSLQGWAWLCSLCAQGQQSASAQPRALCTAQPLRHTGTRFLPALNPALPAWHEPDKPTHVHSSPSVLNSTSWTKIPPGIARGKHGIDQGILSSQIGGLMSSDPKVEENIHNLFVLKYSLLLHIHAYRIIYKSNEVPKHCW